MNGAVASKYYSTPNPNPNPNPKIPNATVGSSTNGRMDVWSNGELREGL